MIKVLLLDGDGVTIKQHRYFSDMYAEKNNVPIEKITPFFKDKFSACQKGQADLKKEIEPYLKDWKWDRSADEFLKLWFETETQPDQEVLDFAQTLRSKGITVYLATDQEKYRAEYMNNQLGFSKYFDGTFYSCDVGHRKSEKEYFEYILQDLKASPAEVAYLDDDKENIQIAKQLGIDAKVYTGIGDLSY